MKHINTHYHFVREYIEDGQMKVEFVRLEEHKANIFTKNLSREYYKKHQNAIMGLEANIEVRNRKGVDGYGISHLNE